jgi:hypothetical protein
MEGEGSQYFTETETYKDPFDPANEQITFDYLIKSLESCLAKLKPQSYYLDRLGQLESRIDSLDNFHLLNVMRMHADEYEILKGNLDYLTKT